MSPGGGGSLFDALASAARRASDDVLAALTGAGAFGTAAILLLTPHWWRAALPLLCISAFGAWGIADRERGRGGRRDALLRALQACAATVGVAAAFTVLLVMLSVALGTWIS